MSDGPRRTNRLHRELAGITPDGTELVQGPAERFPGRTPIRRLSMYERVQPFDLPGLIRTIECCPTVCYLCDANMFIGHTDPVLWHALLATGNVTLLSCIAGELESWLAQPACNPQVRDFVAACVNGDDSPVRRFVLPDSDFEFVYYVNLLGMRKEFHEMVRIKRTDEGLPADDASVQTEIQRVAGERGAYLAKQGRQSTVPAHRYNDERLVVAAFLYSIRAGQSVTLLTRDEGVLDQFQKAYWILDCHYKSMLFAKNAALNPSRYGAAVRPNPMPGNFDGDEVLTLDKPSLTLNEFLPANPTTASLNCMLLRDDPAATERTIAQVVVCVEREMGELLDVKVRTLGLSTDCFEGRNLHVFLGNQYVSQYGGWAFVCRDRGVTLANGMVLSGTDINLVLLPNHRTVELHVVDPDTLLLPARYQD